VPAKISSSKQLAKFNASSIKALHDETNELEDAWDPTVELPKISGQQILHDLLLLTVSMN